MRDFTEQELVRREKVDKIRDVCNPYPERYEVTHEIKDVINLEDGTKNVRVAGRIVFMRKMGKMSFLTIRDIKGKIQLSIKIDMVGEEQYKFFKEAFDIGDFIGASGEVFTTHTGEKTIRVDEFTFLGKALRPLPEKFHGLTDTEIKYRERYVDLIMNEETRRVFLGRSKLYAFIHKYLGENGFLQVETPILQTAVCGASARPFYTHHNALDMDCNLRIAPETYLKQCIAAGDNTKFYQGFVRGLLQELIGSTTVEYQGHVLDFGAEWKRINYVEALTEKFGFDFLSIEEPEELKKKIVEKGLFTYEELDEYKSLSQIIDFSYKKLIRVEIIEPTIIYNYPAVLIPLARRNDKNNKIIDVFQVLASGTELCKAYSELVDPQIQRQAFEEQLKAKAQGDEETMDMDETFLAAMEQGMPPISGLGFGIDRLLMIIFNQPSIRDVVLFPLMKPLS